MMVLLEMCISRNVHRCGLISQEGGHTALYFNMSLFEAGISGLISVTISCGNLVLGGTVN